LVLLLLALPARAEDKPAETKVEDPGSRRTEAEKKSVSEDDYVVRLSLPTESDFEAWASEGLRIRLGYAHGWLGSFGPSVPSTDNGALVMAQIRLDRWWSVAATAEYAIAGGDLTGLRWAATLEPTLHPWRGLSLALGIGYGGLIVSRTRFAARPGGSEVATRTLADSEKVNNCQGGGLTTLARAEYLVVVGPIFSTGPFVQGQGQWTRCEEAAGVNAETGLQIARVQWWKHAGGSLGWWLAWR